MYFPAKFSLNTPFVRVSHSALETSHGINPVNTKPSMDFTAVAPRRAAAGSVAFRSSSAHIDHCFSPRWRRRRKIGSRLPTAEAIAGFACGGIAAQILLLRHQNWKTNGPAYR
jgi:hypothetical protein